MATWCYLKYHVAMVAPRHLVHILFIAATLAACAPATPAPTATPSPLRSPTPVRPTATATLAAEVSDPSIIRGPGGALWAVGRMTNQSTDPVQGVDIQLNLMDNEGREVGQVVTTPNPPILPAGGRANFAGQVPAEVEVAVVAADLMRYQSAQANPIELEVKVEEIIDHPAGGSRLIGALEHDDSDALELVGLSVVAERGAEIIGLPARTLSAHQLPPGASPPWSAEFGNKVDPEALSFTAYALPSTRVETCLVVLEEAPGFQLDPQGNPFFSGVLQNQEQVPCQARLLLLVELDGQPVDLVAIDSPIPLAGSEQRPLGFRPQILAGNSPLEDLALETHLETSADVIYQPQPLQLQLTSFENLGSNLALAGTVTNDADAPVHQATVFGGLRATDGQLLTAGWQPLPVVLEPDQRADFVLLLPITEEFEVNLAEFDLRALGLESAQSTER